MRATMIMQKINMEESTKNIPIGKNSDYIETLIAKTEDLLRRMRWKVFSIKILKREKMVTKTAVKTMVSKLELHLQVTQT